MTMMFLRSLNFRSLISALGFMVLSFVASADDATPAGLIPALSGEDASSWTGLQRYGINIGGWAAAGITTTPIVQVIVATARCP